MDMCRRFVFRLLPPSVIPDLLHSTEDRTFGPQRRAEAEAICKQKQESSKVDYEFRDYEGQLPSFPMCLVLSIVGRHCSRLCS
jgi:hypothetical protein